MGRVFKGKRMAGRKGGDVCNLRRVVVVYHDKDNKIILLKGAVPGAYNSLVKLEEYGY
jgi:large subunit ribosomal protein L3